MTKDKALKLALEALEWSHGGEPMPTVELEAMNAIRQVLAEQEENEMSTISDIHEPTPEEEQAWEELKAIIAIRRQALADQKGSDRTDKLKETVETAIQELRQVVATLNALRVWRGTRYEYSPILPDQYLPLRNTIDWQVAYLKEALAEWTPDDTAYRPDGLSQDSDQLPDATKMIDKDFALNVALETLYNFADDESVDGWKAIDAIGVVRKALSEPPVKSYCGGKPNYCEPEMPIDRGAWSDVEDATKWVDDLRGDDSSTDVVEPVVYVHLEEWLDDNLWPEDAFSKNPHEGMTPLYTASPKQEKPVANVNTSEECVPNPDKQRHEWQWLTEEDIHDLFMSNETVDDFGDFETIACAVSTKLKGKNNG
jgi:hypothetical protein